MTTPPAARPARPHFSSGPCAKPPGWTPDQIDTRILGRSHRSGLGKERLKLCIDLMREMLAAARHPPHRHRPRLRHRRLRNGDVDDARRAPGHLPGLGKLRRRLGDRRGQAAEARSDRHPRRLWRSSRPQPGRLVERRAVHLERHDFGRPRSRRRLDRRGPRGAELRRRDQRGVRLRPAVGQDRCRHLQLAEGAGRRRRRMAC